MINRYVTILLCLFIQCAVANDQIPAPPQTKAIVLINGTVHTVSGATIDGGHVLFEDGKITAVGKNIFHAGYRH